MYDADLQGYFDSIPHEKLLACVKQRIADGSVLKLIQQWLEAPIVETGEDGKPKVSRSRQGTPQGGVISPLLANIYLHWFGKVFHRKDGPVVWAKGKLVRYADDFVILAHKVDPRLTEFVESLLEGRFGLKINRDKTRVVHLREPKQSLDFLGYSFRYCRDLYGRDHRYLNVVPSDKALARARQRLRELTSSQRSFVSVSVLIRELNTYLRGWANYFGYGYPRVAFRKINRYVRERLIAHLRRRSQRPYRVPPGMSFYAHLDQLGLVYL